MNKATILELLGLLTVKTDIDQDDAASAPDFDWFKGQLKAAIKQRLVSDIRGGSWKFLGKDGCSAVFIGGGQILAVGVEYDCHDRPILDWSVAYYVLETIIELNALTEVFPKEIADLFALLQEQDEEAKKAAWAAKTEQAERQKLAELKAKYE